MQAAFPDRIILRDTYDTHSYFKAKPAHLFFLLKSQMNTARMMQKPRMQARTTEKMIPGDEAANTRYIPPFPFLSPHSTRV